VAIESWPGSAALEAAQKAMSKRASEGRWGWSSRMPDLAFEGNGTLSTLRAANQAQTMLRRAGWTVLGEAVAFHTVQLPKK
jgi:hypothetical protein